MPTASYGVSLSVGGVSISKSIVRTGDHPNTYEVPLPYGQAGTIAVLDAANNKCNVTLALSHGIVNTDTVDLYWSTASINYGMVASAVNTTQATLTGTVGTALPVANTAVVVTKQVTINTQIDGDAVQILGLVAEFVDQSSTARAHINMCDTGDASIEVIALTANQPRVYDIGGGDANVFTGNPITYSMASNGSSTANATLKILSLEDSTP